MYPDVCADAAAKGIQLCPIPPGNVGVSDMSIDIPSIPELPKGHQDVKVHVLLAQSNVELGCVDVAIQVDIN